MKPDARRHDLDLAALFLREAVHFSRLGGPIDIERASEIALELGERMDDFMAALGRECGHNECVAQDDPFYTAAVKIATCFEERAAEIRSGENSDPRADFGCWAFHNGRE